MEKYLDIGFDFFCGDEGNYWQNEEVRKRKFALRSIFYVILTILVLIGPISSFSIEMSKEMEKDDEDSSTTEIIMEFLTTLVLLAITWVWITIRICCTCNYFKQELCNDCSNCSTCWNQIIYFFKKFGSCGRHICVFSWCLLIFGCCLVLTIPFVVISLLMKGYYIYLDVHGTAANMENAMCAIISGKQGVEIQTRKLLDEFGDVTAKSTESFQGWNIFLLILIIIFALIVYCKKKWCCKYLCCCWMCACWESECCEKCLGWIIDIAVEKSFGNDLKEIMDIKVEDISSEENDKNHAVNEIELI